MGRLVLTISSSTTPQLHHHHNPPPNWRRPKSNKNGIKEEKMMGQEGESSNGETNKLRRLPLSEVVGDCVRRWFRDTLNEAKAGDINMQVLVGQMYYSGYGVPRDAQKVFLIFFFNFSWSIVFLFYCYCDLKWIRTSIWLFVAVLLLWIFSRLIAFICLIGLYYWMLFNVIFNFWQLPDFKY